MRKATYRAVLAQCPVAQVARLRKLKTTKKGQKLSDGKPIAGRNRLTDAMIDKLQSIMAIQFEATNKTWPKWAKLYGQFSIINDRQMINPNTISAKKRSALI